MSDTSSTARGESRWTATTPVALSRGPVLLGYLVVLLFFAGLGIWAATANIASATIANGVVSPEGSRKTIQHLEGGIITEILVDEGDSVHIGDSLVVLQEIQARAGFEELQHKKYLFVAKLARLLAEQSGKQEVEFPAWLLEAEKENSEISEVLEAQRDLFAARTEVHQGRKAIGGKRIDELQEEITGLKHLVKTKRQQLASLDEELVSRKKLVDKKLISRPQYLELQRTRSEVEGEMAESRADIARAKQNIGETELQIVNEDARRLDEVVGEVADTRAELSSVEERLGAKRDILERTVIVAPVAGTIHNIQFHTIGGVIKPGQSILDIVPLEVELLIDAHVRPVDIDAVAQGQQARVHFLAFSARDLPETKGIVRSVSADSLLDEITGESYYRALVEVPKEELDKLGEAMEINPGMPAEVLIMTGERTMIQYLIQPLMDSLRRSFREN